MLLFPRRRITFDTDLLSNSHQGLETLVKVGGSLGRATPLLQGTEQEPDGPQTLERQGAISYGSVVN